jgi:recombinational DNA repair protein (RecF pathway)
MCAIFYLIKMITVSLALEFVIIKSMQEYVTDAIVLIKRPSGELDGRYALFTKKFGKMTGRATSSRKITSKLAGHLEPGSAVKVRFIEQKGSQIVDALKSSRADISLRDLAALADLLPEMDPDAPLWEYLSRVCDGELFSWRSILKLLGWDPEGAACAGCGKSNLQSPIPNLYFYIPRQEFFCLDCFANLSTNERGSAHFISLTS